MHQKLLLLLLCGLVVKLTSLDDLVINVELEPGAHIHRLFHTLLSYELQDVDGLGLTNTMCTILGLQIGV